MVKNAITNLDSSKASGPDFIQAVVPKNHKPELLYILVEVFNVSKGVLFYRLLEGLNGGPCI